MKTQSYRRGSYNKTLKKTRKIYVAITKEDYLQLQVLSDQLKKSYSGIMREGFLIFWNQNKLE